MEVYNTEEEQVEALKRWWDKNGTTLIIALVVFLAGVFGFQRWQQMNAGEAEAASVRYQQMMGVLDNDAEQAREQARKIIADFPASGYADLAALALARLAVTEGDMDGAAAHFRRVMEAGNSNEVKLLARLRLARIQLAQGAPDKALSTIETVQAGSFGAAYDELKGDIYLSQGKPDEARAAYNNALAGYTNVQSKAALLQMKLDDLATEEN